MIHEEKNCYKIVCQSFVGRYEGRGSKTKIIVDEDSKITYMYRNRETISYR